MLRQDMNIDLMLLDINMPKVDGFTVLEYMNQFRWIDEIPVVMISAADDHESIERCYGLGVSDSSAVPSTRSSSSAASRTRSRSTPTRSG